MKSYRKYLIAGATLGFVIMVSIPIVHFFINRINADVGYLIPYGQIRDSGSVIPPYYDKSAFELPKDLKKDDVEGAQTVKLKIPIIMYHYIEYVKDDKDIIRKKLNITPANLDSQLKGLIDNRYVSYFVKDMPKFISENKLPNDKIVVLTFDDGYEDFYTDALPILKKYNMKATLYVVNNFIDKSGYLTESELKEIIASNLVEIGSHTLDHVGLKTAPLSFAKKEIELSKRLLEEKFAITVETFAYPYGSFSKDVVEIVKSAGFTAAVSVIPGAYQSEDNLFYLNRLRPGLFPGKMIGKALDNWKK